MVDPLLEPALRADMALQAQIRHGAIISGTLMTLLIEKGIITEAEYDTRFAQCGAMFDQLSSASIDTHNTPEDAAMIRELIDKYAPTTPNEPTP